MPAFIESPVFPLAVSFGHSMGPSFSTDIVETDGGQEFVNQNWSYPLQHAKVSINAARAGPMAIIRQWIYVARGRARGFRVTDPNDFEVPDTLGIGVLVQIDGSTYQLCKRYARGTETFDRAISKPKVGSTSIYDVTSSGETLKLLNTHYTIDESTGIVSILFTPDGDLEWRGSFHVPMRFDLDDHEFETINREGAKYLQALGEIPLVEKRIV